MDGLTISPGWSRRTFDWRGLPDGDGQIPRCSSRDQALEWMRVGLLATRQVSVSAFTEEGDRVLARVHRADNDDGQDDEHEPVERFVVAEVRDRRITHMRGYATEQEAQDALLAESLPDANRPAVRDHRPERRQEGL